MNIKGSRVLVTGGAGFIGSHLAERLFKEGAQVRVLDNLSTGNLENLDLKNIEFVQGDVRSEEDVKKSLKNIEIVFHQAAQINPAKAVEDPLFDFEVNARGTLNLLVHSLKGDVKKFIMASTNVYGDADIEEEMSEEFSTLATRKSLLSPYAASKVCGEAYLKVASDEFRLPSIRLRYFNVYGPRQLAKSESGVVAIFTLNALAGKPLRIFGDGSQTRDFVYVDDVVEANLLAVVNGVANGGVFNVGSGIETAVNELAQKVVKLSGAQVPIKYVKTRAADFKRARADSKLSKKILGFEPKVGLNEGLMKYINWCRTVLKHPFGVGPVRRGGAF